MSSYKKLCNVSVAFAFLIAAGPLDLGVFHSIAARGQQAAANPPGKALADRIYCGGFRERLRSALARRRLSSSDSRPHSGKRATRRQIS